MKSNYEVLGKYIRPIDVRNRDLVVDYLLGLSITKRFIPSIANTVGTEFNSYKIVRTGQFAYGPVTSRNGDKITIALLDDKDCIISSSYSVFEVIDANELLSEYLMLWFKRPEFDRYARYKSHGSVWEIFDWDELCKVELPVPDIGVQRSIVRAYNTIEGRIRHLRQLNDNLEATAGALFSHCYASLSDEDIQCLSELCSIASSKRIFADEYVDAGIPFYRGKEISQKRTGQPVSDVLYISKKRFSEIAAQFGYPSQGDILITAVGTIGNSYMVQNEVFYFKDGNIIWLKDFVTSGLNYFIFDYMQTQEFSNTLETICIGSTQTALTIESLGKVRLRVPSVNKLHKYTTKSTKIRNEIFQNNAEIQQLSNLQSVLLANLAR